MAAPREESLQARLLRRLETEPEGRALAFADLGDEVRWWTFAEVQGEAARRAAVLAASGVGKGTVCVVVLPSGPLQAWTVLGALLLGAHPLLVAPPVVKGLHSNLRDVLENVVHRTEARALVVPGETEAAALRSLDGVPTAVLTARHLEGGDAHDLPPPRPGPGEVAALQLTSGTTGFPRICVWTQGAVLASLDGMHDAMGLGRGDVCVNWTPLYHDMGLVNNFLLCLVHSVPLVLIPTDAFLLEPAHWLRTLHEAAGTTTWSPNFGFALTARRADDEDLPGVRLDHVRAFWNAAERVHAETLEEFHRRFHDRGVRREALKTNFGCAESVGGATFGDLAAGAVAERVERRRLLEEGIAVKASQGAPSDEVMTVVGAGRPWRGLEVVVLGPGGEPLPDGVVGEVALRTPSRMSGYLGDEEATLEALRGDLLVTGDLGYLRGGELFWVGRARERINLHGKKLDPSDLERVLLRVPGLREGCFAAFGVDDASEGTQRLVVCAELRRDGGRQPAEIAAEVRSRVAAEVGVRVSETLLLPHGSMSKTSSGKRRHTHYRSLYLSGALRALAAAPAPGGGRGVAAGRREEAAGGRRETPLAGTEGRA